MRVWGLLQLSLYLGVVVRIVLWSVGLRSSSNSCLFRIEGLEGGPLGLLPLDFLEVLIRGVAGVVCWWAGPRCRLLPP